MRRGWGRRAHAVPVHDAGTQDGLTARLLVVRGVVSYAHGPDTAGGSWEQVSWRGTMSEWALRRHSAKPTGGSSRRGQPTVRSGCSICSRRKLPMMAALGTQSLGREPSLMATLVSLNRSGADLLAEAPLVTRRFPPPRPQPGPPDRPRASPIWVRTLSVPPLMLPRQLAWRPPTARTLSVRRSAGSLVTCPRRPEPPCACSRPSARTQPVLSGPGYSHRVYWARSSMSSRPG
jgi:hypothetical protein